MKIKNTFIGARMNKDTDERLVKNGEYRHAENIRVANSEDSDAGAIENVLGNEKLTNLALTNAKAIGVTEDGSEEKVYWFVTSDEKDLLLEHNDLTDTLVTILESSKPNSVLNFSTSNLITGVSKITNGDGVNDLLSWTDDLNPPRLINIERAKTYGVDGFDDETISLIKKPPLYAPKTRFTYSKVTTENYLLDKFISFAYRNKYEDGEYSALSSFTNYKFAPKSFKLGYPSMENEGMENIYNAVDITFNTGGSLVKSVDLVYKESGSNTVYIIETFDKEKEGWADNTEKNYIFNNSKINKVLPEDELLRTYDNVPLKAKALELVNDRLIFGNYVEGYDLVDEGDNEINIDYKVSLDSTEFITTSLFTKVFISSPNIEFINFSNALLKEGTKIVFNFNYREQDTGYTGYYQEAFEFLLTKDYADAAELAVDSDFTYFIDTVVNDHFASNFIPTPIPTSETYQTFATITDMLNSFLTIRDGRVYYVEDASGDVSATHNGEYYRADVNGVLTPLVIGDFTLLVGDERKEYLPKTTEVTVTAPLLIDSFDVDTITFNAPVTQYNVTYSPLDDPEEFDVFTTYWGSNNRKFVVNHVNLGIPLSLKSNRSLEASLIYLDEYNRASTALTNSKHNEDTNNTIFISNELSTSQNKMVMSVNSPPPAWATRYKIVVKENKGEYQTIYTNVIYRDGIYRWIKLEGESVNKVKEGDELIVKADSGGAIADVIKTKVLAVETKEEDFILGNIGITGSEVIEESGLYMKIRPVGYSVDAYASRSVIDVEGARSLRYVRPVWTSPEFGEYDDAATPVFTPYEINVGDKIHIRINIKAGGAISYNALYDEEFLAESNWTSVAEWFDNEVINLGTFGTDYTWDGLTSLEHDGDYPNTPVASHKGTGWGFTDNITNATGAGWNTVGTKNFFVTPNRDGTASRDIRTTVDFSIEKASSSVIFETSPDNFNSEIFYETEETFDIVTEGGSGLLIHEGNLQNQSELPNVSGDLVIGNGYSIGTFETGDDFSNVGANNVEGEIFIATGTTPTTWVNGSLLFKTATSILEYGNCYTQGNGVESYRYKDGFNTKALATDIRPTAVDSNGYKSIRRYADLTYSEPYNSNTSINGLNEFNLARANYKADIDKKFGSIQKIYSRDTDLLLFQEDKISKVLYGKNLLMNADGTSNVSIIEDVLGTQISYAGDYGISFNPESFAVEGNNIYFSDVKRGSILRLGLEGINEISRLGLKQWFKEEFLNSVNNNQFGTFDPYFDQYVICTNETNTLTFNEDVKGWTSFYSFIPDFMVGMNNKLFSFKNGELYKHNSENVNHNTFYGVQSASKVSLLVNEAPSEVKELQALSIEGSESWNALITAYVSTVGDDIQSSIADVEFFKKEGLWYAYARRNEDSTVLDSKSTYGIGVVTAVGVDNITVGGGSTSITSGDIIVKDDLSIVGNVVDSSTSSGVTTIEVTTLGTVAIGDFVLGKKDTRVEGGNLRGYTLRVDLDITKDAKVELFAVNSEVIKSYS